MGVSMKSPLKRKNWLKDGLTQVAHTSFWNKFTGMSSNSIVYQVNDASCGTGHTVVFDYSGELTGKQYKGSDYTYGKGEVKRKFSDKIVVEELSLVVNNGSKFEACDIDDLELSQHGHSRAGLSSLFMRQKDQAIFDAAQGSIGQPATHIFNAGTTFDYNTMLRLSSVAKTGKGLVKAGINGVVSDELADRRIPLTAWQNADGVSQYVMIVDEFMALKIKADPKYQTIVINADIRGDNNRAIDMVIGRLGNILYIEAPVFSGFTEGKGTFGIEDTEIQFSGLRQYAVGEDGKMVWEGQLGFDAIEKLLNEDIVNGDTTNADSGNAIYSRGLLLGAGALQTAFGKQPDYKLLTPTNQKTTESMLEYWANFKKTVLTQEMGESNNSKVAGIDYSVIAVDMKH